jgi:hypothetical protein
MLNAAKTINRKYKPASDFLFMRCSILGATFLFNSDDLMPARAYQLYGICQSGGRNPKESNRPQIAGRVGKE